MGHRLRRELCSHGYAVVSLKDLLTDEEGTDEKLEEIMLQAFEAHLIVVVYRQRQTQGWYLRLLKRILAHMKLLAKSTIMIEKSTYARAGVILPMQDWNIINKVAELQVYDKSELPYMIADRISKITQKMEQQIYVKKVLRGRIKEDFSTLSQAEHSVEEFLKAYRRTKDRGLLNPIVQYYHPLIEQIAESMVSEVSHGLDIYDLVSAGIFGLLNALDCFDPNKGTKFGAYCLPYIKESISDEIRSWDCMSRLVSLCI